MSSRRAFIKKVVGVGTVALARPLSAAATAQRPGRVAGFDHVAVPMRNTDAMVAFYRALGFQVNEGTALCSAHVGDHKINFHRPDLWQQKTFTLRASGATPPCGGFCFVWDGDMPSLRTTLDNANAEVIEGPVERPGGRQGGSVGGISLYTRDPDQNLLEFIVYRD